ncbi:MAG: protein kinase [Proteobacteria bacterium]|nr:serine/threonine protein kinase [Pseudomonadota bacterium]NOG59306.1 protein kinase [Pseudomonadota bacterium]
MASTDINAFDFQPGRIIAKKYVIERLLGAGWEAEVYLIRELSTGIEHTAKFFFPQRNIKDKSLKFYARKLHSLRKCPIVIQYSTQETIVFKRTPISFLVSEYVEGELLDDYLKQQPGKRLHPFQALHLLYDLARGMEHIHDIGEYHGDLHAGNIIVQDVGLNYNLKLIDMFQWKDSKGANIKSDVMDLIRLFYDALGGQKHYAKQPQAVKDICCGLKHSIALKKFNSAGKLCRYIENMQWDN